MSARFEGKRNYVEHCELPHVFLEKQIRTKYARHVDGMTKTLVEQEFYCLWSGELGWLAE